VPPGVVGSGPLCAKAISDCCIEVVRAFTGLLGRGTQAFNRDVSISSPCLCFMHYASVRGDGTAGTSVRLWVVRAGSPIRCSCTKAPDMEPPARATMRHVIGRGVQGYVLLKAGMSKSR
jgi:hypothetical protein